MNSLFAANHRLNPKSQKDNDSDGGSDSDMGGHARGSRHRRKNRRGSNDSSTDSSSNEAGDLYRIKKKKDKKLRRDANLTISSPMALGLRWLINDDPTTAASIEKAVLLRAIKPNSTTIEMVYKNINLLSWDHPLIVATNYRMFAHQVQHFIERRKRDKAARLSSSGQQVITMMIIDALKMTPDSLLKVMNAFWNKDPSGLSICDGYILQRPVFTTDPANTSRSLVRLDGLCIGYNFHGAGCNNNDCPYGHYCAFHKESQQQHGSMRCQLNPNKWKSNNRNNNNRRGGGNYRGRNKSPRNHNNRYQQHHHNQYNQWQGPPDHQQQYYQNQQQFQQQFQQIPPQNQGNKDRFFGGYRK